MAKRNAKADPKPNRLDATPTENSEPKAAPAANEAADANGEPRAESAAGETGYPSGEQIRAAFDDSADTRTDEQKEKDEQKARKKPEGPSNLERNTFTMSLVVVVLGLICLPYIETGGSTWYVLMLVFFANAALIIWIVARLLLRRKKR